MKTKIFSRKKGNSRQRKKNMMNFNPSRVDLNRLVLIKQIPNNHPLVRVNLEEFDTKYKTKYKVGVVVYDAEDIYKREFKMETGFRSRRRGSRFRRRRWGWGWGRSRRYGRRGCGSGGNSRGRRVRLQPKRISCLSRMNQIGTMCG
jgi:hypothetical protein